MSKMLRTSLIYNISLLLIVLSAMAGTAGATIRIVDPSGSGTYTTIQSAIDASIDGDTINVNSSTYYESINVNKRLTIRGIDTGSGNPIINYAGTPVTIQSDGVTFNRFVIIGALYNGIWVKSSGNKLNNNNVISAGEHGIFLDHSNNNILINDKITSSVLDGINMYYSNNNTLKNDVLESNSRGIKLYYSNDNIMTNNTVDYNDFGIYLKDSYNNNVSDNTVTNSITDGIEISSSSGNELTNNHVMSAGKQGIFLDISNSNRLTNNEVTSSGFEGIFLRHSDNNILTNNILELNQHFGIQLNNSNNNILTGNDARHGGLGGILVYDSSSNNSLTNNIANDNNGAGLSINANSNYNAMTGNTANSNVLGITSYYSIANTITNNIVTNNDKGVSVSDLSNNNIYNNYFNNTLIGDIGNNNTDTWNIAKTGGINIIGGPYLGGNFWGKLDGTGFSQTCYDDDKDGICDSSYNLSLQNTDYFPLAGNSTRPVAEAGGPYIVDEGTSVTFDPSGSYDPLGGILTYAWDYNGDGIYELKTPPFIRTPRDGPSMSRIVGLEVKSNKGRVGTDTAILTVNNVAPIIDSLSADQYLAQVGTAITGTGTFHDPGILDTFVAEWNWDDTINTINLPNGSVSTDDSHIYDTPGVYSTSLQVTDKDGGFDIENMSQYIVIYDPDGGFVTGGGWIDSPAGSYIANPTLTGRANFGFVSKYKQGATVPTGETEFQFKVADLNFHSTSYDWLVVAGARAQYKGSGTINGEGDYGFMLTAIDGQINGGGGADKFRIKIWEKATETIVYDNQLDATDDSNPTTAIAGGSIVIHK